MAYWKDASGNHKTGLSISLVYSHLQVEIWSPKKKCVQNSKEKSAKPLI